MRRRCVRDSRRWDVQKIAIELDFFDAVFSLTMSNTQVAVKKLAFRHVVKVSNFEQISERERSCTKI